MEQMDAVVREVGDRGKVLEGVKPTPMAAAPSNFDPSPEPAPAPAPARKSKPAPAPAPTYAPAPIRQVHSPPIEQLSSGDASLIAALIERQEEQQRLLLEREEKLRREAKADKAELEAKLSELQAKLDPQHAVSEGQLKALQLRVGKLQADQLLSDDVVFVVEDLIADYIELESSIGKLTREAQANRVVASVCKLVALSERMELDQALARQVKRKFA